MQGRHPGDAFDTSAALGDDLSLQAFRFTEVAQECTDIPSLAKAAQDAVSTVGMTAIASGLVSGPRRVSGDMFHFVNWPEDWLALYLAENYVEKDPVPRWAIVSGMPISWTELLDSLAPDDPGHEVYLNAVKWGFSEGFVTPVRGLDGSLGLVSTGGRRAKLLPRECLLLQSISVTTFHRAEVIAHSSSKLPAGVVANLRTLEGRAARRLKAGTQETVQREAVCRTFGLTLAEWRVASALYEGESLQGIAAIRRVSINTLRAQLASIYAKTGTHRQIALVAALRTVVEAQYL